MVAQGRQEEKSDDFSNWLENWEDGMREKPRRHPLLVLTRWLETLNICHET